MATILDGKGLSEKILKGLKEKISELDRKPTLAVVLVGTDPASQIYVRNKKTAAEKIGIKSLVITLPEDISEQNLIEQIHILNEDKNINAILVQFPLPKNINENKIVETIDPVKDVEGFHPYNIGLRGLGAKDVALPCTPKGILRILKEYSISIEGKNAVVIGRSDIVGKPTAQLLLKENATVTIAHSKTKDLKNHTKMADIIVVAIGKPNFLTEDMVKEGVVIVDVGINRTETKLCGDADFERVKNKASFITPVPKGIGPMTIAMLMENTYELYLKQIV